MAQMLATESKLRKRDTSVKSTRVKVEEAKEDNKKELL